MPLCAAVRGGEWRWARPAANTCWPGEGVAAAGSAPAMAMRAGGLINVARASSRPKSATAWEGTHIRHNRGGRREMLKSGGVIISVIYHDSKRSLATPAAPPEGRSTARGGRRVWQQGPIDSAALCPGYSETRGRAAAPRAAPLPETASRVVRGRGSCAHARDRSSERETHAVVRVVRVASARRLWFAPPCSNRRRVTSRRRRRRSCWRRRWSLRRAWPRRLAARTRLQRCRRTRRERGSAHQLQRRRCGGRDSARGHRLVECAGLGPLQPHTPLPDAAASKGLWAGQEVPWAAQRVGPRQPGRGRCARARW